MKKNIAAIPPASFLRHLRFDEGARPPLLGCEGANWLFWESIRTLTRALVRALILRDLYVSVPKTGVDAEEFFIGMVWPPCGFRAHPQHVYR